MAKNKEETSSSSSNSSNVETNKNITTSILYGVDQNFINNNNIEVNKIKDTIKRISVKNNLVTGDNPIEFLTKMAYNEKTGAGNRLNKLPKDEKGNIDINKLVNGMTLNQINEIYSQELDRISTYDDYEAIVRYIPQVAQGVKIWKDNIISPDDFTKDIFDVIYDDVNDEDLKNKVESNINDIINQKYNIEDKVDRWIENTLIKGEEFVAVLKLQDEFNKMISNGVMSEDGKVNLTILDESTVLNESSVILSENDITTLSEEYLKKMKATDINFNESEFDREKYTADIKNEIADIINSNIKFSTNSATLLEDELPIIDDFRREANKQKYANYFAEKISADGDKFTSSSDKKINGDFIGGSYIKTLEPDRVVKIKVGETVYGYFYIEVRGKNELIHPKNVYSALTLRQTVDLTSSDTSMIDDPKIRIITDLFARNIGEKIDRNFIANNKEFKNIIYELLRKDYIYNNNIQITYFEPSTIKHLMVKEGEDGYGISILRDILFTAKLYLSVLITTLLTKISRSQEHRTYYIETGLSQDVEGIVESFIRDVRTKDVKISDTQSIDSIFTTIGSNADFFIPQVNGEKAIEIDTTPGLNVDMDNDLMEYLRKTMLSGMGIPSSMLQYADEVEFARSLSMQNGMFLRSVIVKQKKLTPPFTSLYQDLYKNEFGTNVYSLFDADNDKTVKKRNTDEEEDVVNIYSIKVQFPSPSSLNSTNIADQISTGQGIVQAIVEAMFNPNGEVDEDHKFVFTQELYTKYVPNVDWKEIEDIYEESKIISVENKIKTKAKSQSTTE